MMQEHAFVSIILAGGKSRRMGRSKAKLVLDNQTLVERQVGIVSPFSARTIVIVAQEDYQYFSVIYHNHPSVLIVTDEPEVLGEGPLAGIYTGMKRVRATHYFVLACDLIHYPSEVLSQCKRLSETAAGFEAFVPVDQFDQPLAAIYTRKCELLGKMIHQGKKRLSDLLSELKICYIREEQWRQWTDVKNPFYNMNHAHEYQGLVQDELDQFRASED